MSGVSDLRAIWLAKHVLPHEAALRAWLRSRRIAGLEVDDVVQETYARLISTESVEDVRNPKTYAFQTAHSVLMTHLRRSRVVSFQAVADIDHLGVTAWDASPEEQVVDRDEFRRLAHCIAAMPARVGEVFTLRRIEGLAQQEVAERLQISESTVEKHMSRAFILLATTFGRGGKRAVRASKTRKEETRTGYVQRDSPTD